MEDGHFQSVARTCDYNKNMAAMTGASDGHLQQQHASWKLSIF